VRGVDSGRQAYSRLTDDKRVIYYRELPAGTAAPPAPPPPPSLPSPSPRSLARRRPPSLRPLPRPPSASLPVPHGSLLSCPPSPPLATRPSVAALQITPPPPPPATTPPRALFEGRSISIMAPTPTANVSHALSALCVHVVVEAHELDYAWSHRSRNVCV